MMSVSKTAAVDQPRDPRVTKAVDNAGQVWVHPDPIELYRFLQKRNLLLAAIAGRPR